MDCSYNSISTEIYRLMLNDKKYGLSVNWMATRAMPSLLPQTINPALNLEQFELLLKVLQDMLNHIERWSKNVTDFTYNFYEIMNNRYFLFTLLIVIFSFFLFISFEFFVVFSFLFLVLFVRLLFVPLKSGTRGINWRWIICHYRARNGIEVYDISTVRTICTLPPLIYQIYVSSNVKLLRLKTWLEKIARVIKIIYKI